MVVPIFKLNSKEQWRPQAVETAERFGTIDGQPVQLSNLPAAGGRIDFPPTMRDPSNTPVVGYHRVVEAANARGGWNSEQEKAGTLTYLNAARDKFRALAGTPTED